MIEREKMDALFRPGSIAVVGASENPGPGLNVMENLKALGYEGKMFPVNPKYDRLFGLPCYPSLTAVHDAGHRVDTVAILLGKAHVVPVMEEAAAIGVKAGWAFAAGFGETDEEGKALERKLKDLCREKGMLFLGPNCVGYLNPNHRCGTFSAPAPKEIKAGNIGLVAQSGYLGLAIANSSRGTRFSLLATTGNEAVVDATDCISYMLEDEGTDVVLAFIEQFRAPEKLVAAAQRARELRKPIVLIKVGKSAMAQRATVAHTGALAGSDDVQDALFEKLGIIRVNDFDEMFETAELLAGTRDRLPRGNRVFAVTLSGGVISLMGDLSEEMSFRFPEWSDEGRKKLREYLPPFSGIANPLDAWGSGRIEETYEPCLEILADEPEADVLLVVQDVPAGMSPRQVEQYKVVARAAVDVATRTDKPILMLSNQSSGFHQEIRDIMAEGKVPLLQGTRESLLAVHNLVRYGEFLRKPTLLSTVRRNQKIHELLPEGDTVLNEVDSKKIITAYGVPMVKEFLCTSREEAMSRADELGYPVALKLISDEIQHKTEAKVVRLNLPDRESVGSAYDEVMRNAERYKAGVKVKGVLCSRMVRNPVAEAILGVVSDPYFGPALLFGMGGVMVEVIKDRVLMIPPVTREEARRAVDATKGSRLLYGFRGKPVADVDALVDMIVKVGDMTADLSERIEALDINPLMILPEGEGVVAVDALVALKKKKESIRGGM